LIYLSAATTAAATMSGMIRLAMFVTLIVLVSLVVEQEAFKLSGSVSKMLAVKAYSAADRARAMQLMRERAINKIRANIQGSQIHKAHSKCDTDDLNVCMPTGPEVNFSTDMSLQQLQKFCDAALTFATCIGDIDFDGCEGTFAYDSYVGAASAAMMYSVLCYGDTINDVYMNLECIVNVLNDESCEDVFDDRPTDTSGVCKDTVAYLQCYYDETMDLCKDEVAANVVQQTINVKISTLLNQFGIDCTPKSKSPTKSEDIMASLMGAKHEKRSQLLDLLDKLAAINKKST